MNLFKKVIATIAMTTLVATATVSSVSAYTNDSKAAAATLAAKGIIVDHSDNVAAYELGNLVKRQEVAAMAFSIAKLTKKTTCDNEFTDVTATTPNTWACYVVEALRDNGYLAKNAKFRPEANISKAEALGMVVSAAFADDYKYDATKGTSWQEQLVDFAVSNNILDAAFTDYNTPATRGTVFQWTVNAIDAADSDDLGGLDDLLGDLDDTDSTDTTDNTDTTDTTDNTVTTADLTVELNPESPAGADLPQGADGVSVLKLDVTAGNEDTTVTELNFERTGFGEDAVAKISLFANGTRLTKSKTFNSDDEANVSISPALVVKAGETTTVEVRVDTDSDESGEFAIKLTGVTASTNVNASEIVSNTFDVKDGVEATVLEFKEGSVNSQVTAGELQADVAEFDLKNTGNVNNSDVTVTSITLKEIGTVDQESDLANLTLVNDGKEIASVEAMAGKYVTFNLATPIVIKDGKTETFTVKADIVGGADDKIKFVLDTEGDIAATASKYTAVNVDNKFAGQEVTIQAGELTIYAIDAENDKIRDDKDDVVLGTLKVVNVAGEDLQIKNLGVKLTTSNSGVAQVLENVKAEINGTSYDLYAPSNTANTATGVVYSDSDLDITLPQGTTMVTIVADTLDDLVDGETIKMSLDVNDTQLYVEEAEDDKKVTDVTPSTLTWDDLEIKQPKATVSKTPLANVSVVKGTSDITALQFEVEANETSALTIDEVKAKVTYAGGYGTSIKDYVSEVKLYKGSVSEANKLDSLSGNKLGSNGEANFDGFEVTVDADATETFIVVVSTVDSDAVANSEVTVSFTSVNVEDDENDTVTVENTAGEFAGKTITLKDSGTLTLNVTGSTDNADNQEAKTILAGTEQTVFSIDTKATNEEIDLERIKFEITSASGTELRDSIKEAKLYLGNNLVATTPNSKVTETSGVVTISFEDMTNTVIPTTSDELRLAIVTETIGYEKIGSAIASAKVTAVKVDKNYAKGVESNEKIAADLVVDTTNVAKDLAIVPMIVTPSVTDTFGNTDGTAKVTLAIDAGDNTSKSDGSSLSATLKEVKLTLLNAKAGSVAISNGQGEVLKQVDIADADTGATLSVSDIISNGEVYEFTTNAEAQFKLNKDGIKYVVDDKTYTISLSTTQDMGQYSK